MHLYSHGRTTVDLTLAFRFSGLSNNAKLELVKALQPRSLSQGEVTIALQLESGDRLQESFQPSTTLWDILMYWELQDEGSVAHPDESYYFSLNIISSKFFS